MCVYLYESVCACVYLCVNKCVAKMDIQVPRARSSSLPLFQIDCVCVSIILRGWD